MAQHPQGCTACCLPSSSVLFLVIGPCWRSQAALGHTRPSFSKQLRGVLLCGFCSIQGPQEAMPMSRDFQRFPRLRKSFTQLPQILHGFPSLQKNRACFGECLLLMLIYADMPLRTWCGNFNVRHHWPSIIIFGIVRGCKLRHCCMHTVSHTWGPVLSQGTVYSSR